MWRLALIAVVIGIVTFVAIALRKRAYVGLELAGAFSICSGSFILLTLFGASAFSYGTSAMNVRREAIVVAPLGGVMVAGGLALLVWARDQLHRERRNKKPQ